MLGWRLFKKRKPRIYLGSVDVAPRGTLEKIDEWGVFKGPSLENEMRWRISKILTFPTVQPLSEHKPTDLALDIEIVGLQGGELLFFSADAVFLPIFWRPKVKVVSKVRNILTNKPVASVSVREKMPWSRYFAKVLSINGLFFRYKPLFSADEVEALLCLACMKLCKKLGKAV